LIEIINKPLLLHLVGYLYYWQMGFNSVFKGLIVQPKHAAHLTCDGCRCLWTVGVRSWTAGQLKVVKLAVNV